MFLYIYAIRNLIIITTLIQPKYGNCINNLKSHAHQFGTTETQPYTRARDKRYLASKLFDDKLDILGMVEDPNKIIIRKLPGDNSYEKYNNLLEEKNRWQDSIKMNRFNTSPNVQKNLHYTKEGTSSTTSGRYPQTNPNQYIYKDTNYDNSSNLTSKIKNTTPSYIPEIIPITADELLSQIPKENTVKNKEDQSSFPGFINNSITIISPGDTSYIKRNAIKSINNSYNKANKRSILKSKHRSTIADHSSNGFKSINKAQPHLLTNTKFNIPTLNRGDYLLDKFKKLAKQKFKETLKSPNKILSTNPTNAEMMEYYYMDPIVWRRIMGVCKIYIKFIAAKKLENNKLKRIKKILNKTDRNSQRIINENEDQLSKYEYHRKLFKYWCFSLKRRYHRISKQLRFIEEFLNTIDEVRVRNDYTQNNEKPK